MTVRELATQLKLEVCCGAAGLDKEIKGGYTSDLLSDVMGNAREGNIWITLQTHKNIMAIASLKELAAIVLVKGYRPEEDTVSESEAEGIPILSTSRQTFEMTGEIYELLQKKEQYGHSGRPPYSYRPFPLRRSGNESGEYSVFRPSPRTEYDRNH